MTNEQRIRGADAGFDWAIVVAGYSEDALDDVCRVDLSSTRLADNGAADVAHSTYRLDYALSHDELVHRCAPPPHGRAISERGEGQ